MSTEDLDTRGREAARAARTAVRPVVEATSPRFRPGRARLSRAIGFAIAGACVVAGLLALAVLSPSGTRVSTGPAAGVPTTTTPPPLPPTGLPSRTPFETPITSGRTSDGRTWSLFIGGPSNDLCLGVDLGDGSGAQTSTCAGSPFGAPALDPYQPHFHNDLRVIPTVFGRVAPDIVGVEVVRATGQPVGPVPVIHARGGPFYVVELPGSARPVAVIGHRADGTTVRYSVLA